MDTSLWRAGSMTIRRAESNMGLRSIEANQIILSS